MTTSSGESHHGDRLSKASTWPTDTRPPASSAAPGQPIFIQGCPVPLTPKAAWEQYGSPSEGHYPASSPDEERERRNVSLESNDGQRSWYASLMGSAGTAMGSLGSILSVKPVVGHEDATADAESPEPQTVNDHTAAATSGRALKSGANGSGTDSLWRTRKTALDRKLREESGLSSFPDPHRW